MTMSQTDANIDEKSLQLRAENEVLQVSRNTGIPVRIDILNEMKSSQRKQELVKAMPKVIEASNKMHEITSNQELLINEMDSNDNRQELMKNNIRNQRKWNKTFVNCLNGAIGVAGMASSAVVNVKNSDQFEKYQDLLETSLTNIAFDAVEQQMDNSDIVNTELLACHDIIKNKECKQLLSQIEASKVQYILYLRYKA